MTNSIKYGLGALAAIILLFLYNQSTRTMLAAMRSAPTTTTKTNASSSLRTTRRRFYASAKKVSRKTTTFALADDAEENDGHGEEIDDDRAFIDSFERDGSATSSSSASSAYPLPVKSIKDASSSNTPRRKTQREIEAQTIEDANGFHAPWSQYELRVEEDDDDETTPWEEHIKEVMGKKANWPCWDFTKPEEEYEPEPEFVSFQKPPEKYDAFEEKARLYKERVKKERAQAMKDKEEQIKKFRYLSQDGDIRLRDKSTVDESEWDHEKIVELINFDPKERKRMMQSSVEVYDPRFPYDFGECPDPPEDTLDFLYNIGRLCVDDEWEDQKWIEMTGEPTPKFDDLDLDKEEQKEELGLEEMREEKLMKAKDIGFDDDDEEEDEEDNIED